MSERFTFDQTKIVYEILNNEVVLVNLDNGHYYMMQGSAALIWRLLSAGLTIAESVERLNALYPADPVQIQRAVSDFVLELRSEELLIPAVAATPTTDDLALDAPASGQPFELPAMYKYTDMANLIQMDPIREFDETGWPKRKSFRPAAGK
jgi:hypothetical protein